MYFATVYPIHINNYMNSQMKIHKEKTGHVITPSQMKPEVNAKLNELVHWLNSLIKDVCREHGLPLWDMFHVVCRGYEASATRQYVLKDGIYPSERIAEELNRSFFPFARGKLIQKFCENVKEYNFLYRPLPTCSDYPTNKIWPKNVDSKLSTEKTQRGVHQSPLKKTEASKPTNEKIKMGYASENKEAPKILSPSQSSGALNYEKSKILKEEKKGPIKEESNPVVSKHPESQKHVDDTQRQIPEISCPKGSYEKSKTLEEEKKGPTKEGTNSDISKYPGSQKQVDVWQRLSPKISFPKGSYEKSKTLEEEKKGPTKEGTNSDIPKYPGSQKQVAVWQRLSPKISFPKGSYEKSKTLEEEKKGPIKEGTNSDISKYPGSQKHVDVRQRLSPKISFPKGSYQKSKTLNEEKEGPTKEVTKSNICKHPESQKYVDDRQKQSPETSCPQGRSVGLAVKGAINCCLYHCEQSKTLKEEKKGPTKEETKSDISKHPESQKQRPSPETSFPQRSYKKIKISKEENEGPTKEEESSDKSKHPESQSQSPGISFPKAGYKKSKNLEEEKKSPTKEETNSDISKHPEKQKHVDDKQKQRPETSFPKGSYQKSKTWNEEKEGPNKEMTNSNISKHPESQKYVDDRQKQSPETSCSQGRSVDLAVKSALNCCLYHCKKSKTLKEETKGPTKEETNSDISKHPESQKQRQSPETSYSQRSYKKMKISKEKNEGPTKEETNADKSKHPDSQKHVHDQQRHRPETSYPQGSYEKNKTLEEEKKDPTKEGTNSDISKYPESKKHVDVRQRPSPEISFPKGSYEKSKTLKEEKIGLKEEKKDPTKEGTNSDISKHPESQRHADTRERQSPRISFPKGRSHQPDTDTSVSCVEAKKHSSNPVHRRLSPKDDRLSPFTRSEDRGPGFIRQRNAQAQKKGDILCLHQKCIHAQKKGDILCLHQKGIHA
ncbi:neurofilament heavy polypeptide-like isoform X3 [Macrobrachium rosenbergii]|uniref:neurofilament heavy polypeptide-like isoform X3 n=1 Tax=Macrobrachium rosenbergii TaxID=79674 RepID=UPI0034D70612